MSTSVQCPDGFHTPVNPAYIHPQAIVEVTVGQGTRIWAFTHVMPGVSIGTNCNIGEHCFLESGTVVGDDVTIKNGNMLWQGVTLENGTFVGPHVFFTNDRYPRSPRLPQAIARYQGSKWRVPTVVRLGASLGAGAVLLAGTIVGQFAMIGAGAVVTHDVPPYALVIGNPARRIGWVCQCGYRLHFHATEAACGECGSRYGLTAESTVDCITSEVRRDV